MAQPKSRAPLAIGLTAAAGVGYYLYQSGGNARVAEKKFEGKAAADTPTVTYFTAMLMSPSGFVYRLLTPEGRSSRSRQGSRKED